MSTITPPTGDQLASALHSLGVNFLLGGANHDESLHKQPARLIAELAESKEARLRLSLIPLFLEHPELASCVRKVAQDLGPTARLTLQCYYTAAVSIQKKYHGRIRTLNGGQASLPDLFSRELGLQITNDPEQDLYILAERHRILSDTQVNWLGTYQHAAQIWLSGLELQNC